MKNNKPVCVVLNQIDFDNIIKHISLSSSRYNNLWNWLDKPVTGKCTREEIDSRINADRDNWGYSRKH